MAQSLRINGKYYPTKQTALDYFGGVLGRYGVGEAIYKYHDDLEDLLRYHPNAKEKFGKGIYYFKCGMNTEYDFSTKCFYVMSKNENGVTALNDFSFIKIIKNYNPHKKLKKQKER